MSNTITIYRREMGHYFTSPIAYIFICAFLGVMAVYFFLFNGFFQQQNPDLRSYFVAFPFAFALLIPAVTMRLWSEEKKAGTVEVLMTLPLKSWEVVLGKFLAGYTVIALTLLLTLTIPITISFILEIQWGIVFSSYVGALLLAAVYVAVGAWVSALTQNQIVALSRVEPNSDPKLDFPRALMMESKVKGKPPAECEKELELGPPVVSVRSDATNLLTQLYDARLIKEFGAPHYCILKFDEQNMCDDVEFLGVGASTKKDPSKAGPSDKD